MKELAIGTSDGDGSLWKLKYDYGELDSNGVDVDTNKNTGNIAKQTLTFNGLAQPLVQTFKYDSLYRLTEAKEISGTDRTWEQRFGYDRYGNRTGLEKFSGTSTTPLPLNNKTHPTIDPNTNRFNSGQNIYYDKNGNIIQDVGDQDAVRTFVFNGDNKQRFVVQSGKTIGEYFYDGEGQRVKKVVYEANTTTVKEETVFVYSAGKLVEEYSTKTPPSNPTTSYTATDQLGSPRVITNSLGEVVSRRDFMPFGEEITNNIGERAAALNLKYGVADGIRQKFTGYQKDEETGLDFAEARMYENRHGRFTAVDPLLASGKSANPQTFNRYVYVMNRPLIVIDPNGLQAATDPNEQNQKPIVFDFYIRSFAPYNSFGEIPRTFYFVGDGDDRGFSTSLAENVTSRMVGHIRVDSSQKNIRDWYWNSEVSRSEIVWYGDYVAKGEDSECYITPLDPTTSNSEGNFGFNLAGNNDAFPIGIGDWNLSMDIDLNAKPKDFGFKIEQGLGSRFLTFNGPITGDQFPAAETFVRDLNGNSVFLGVFSIPEGANPYSNLPGLNYRPMIFVKDVNIQVDDQGIFESVISEGQSYTIDDWNRRFTSQSPKPK